MWGILNKIQGKIVDDSMQCHVFGCKITSVSEIIGYHPQ